MKRLLAAALLLALPLPAREAALPERSAVDLALCLDTSGSMQGLLESAKIKLWAIVNELATAKPTPVLRVALLTYGNNGHDPASGWVRVDAPFTTDLDALYAKLGPLTTDGGEEYVARVVRAASELDWTPSAKALKLVIVAGNEAATQDPTFKIRDVFAQAIAKGIQVNTIFCGSPVSQEAVGWREAAGFADGQYAVIDQDHGTVLMATPMDARLAELSGTLNGTYLGYGRQAEQGRQNQVLGDLSSSNAAPMAAAERACSKAGGLYRNAGWDLVDACKDGKRLEELKEEELPEEMQKLKPEERKAYVERKASERAAIQEEILRISEERATYLVEEMRKQGKDGSKALDAAILKALRCQGERKGLRFE